MEDLERIKDRLDNIASVEPILTALRTISAGSLRLAHSRLEAARLFAEELGLVLDAVRPHLPSGVLQPQSRGAISTVGMLVIASERGLCGAFNTTVLEAAEGFLAEQVKLGRSVKLITLGARATTHFQRRGKAIAWSESLPMTTVAPLALTQRLSKRLSTAYNSGQFDLLYAVYTPYRLRTSLKPVMHQILPAEVKPPSLEHPSWPPPIIDVDPMTLYERVQDQWSTIELYRCIMESAASEQSARFHVLDGASNNAQRLIEELTLSYHVARQHAITMEMLDLVGGAGLLKRAESHNPDDDS